MTQNAVVTKLISRHVAEVEVERGTACGGTCESCEACVFQSRIRAEALNKVSALPGVRLFFGYAIGSALGWGEGGCVLIGFAFFALGVACNVVYQRRKKASPITFEIIQVLET